ncbi:MAG: lipid-A-disaccharide synthase [Fimbriimonadaceae bacterium]|nr:lipid-A-disaccharide synthase [Chitinophagales bacterium]
MKFYIIAGEASGDMHAANLVYALKEFHPTIELRGWGGDKMKDAGVQIVKHYRDLAFMGFVEVVKHLNTIFKNIKFCREDIEQYKPEAVIFIDYPGFNLRILPFVKNLGIKTIYYISPQLWAWNSKRVNIIKRYADKMLVILPFEKDFYKNYQYEVDFVGHPLLDEISNKMKNPLFYKINNLSKDPIIAILPGSRKQEIAKNLPIMLSLTKHFPEFIFVIACAPGLHKQFYEQFYNSSNIYYLFNQTYDILLHAEAAVVTSGTATLETALFNVPQIVCYKGNIISYIIAKQLVHVKYISLVNLILDKEVVPELIQHTFAENKLKAAFQRLVFNDDYRTAMRESYSELKNKLGDEGASERAAKIISDYCS